MTNNHSEEALPRLDKSAFSVSSLAADGTPADEREEETYWHSKTPEERLRAVEINRQLVYGYGTTAPRLQRILEIVECPWR